MVGSAQRTVIPPPLKLNTSGDGKAVYGDMFPDTFLLGEFNNIVGLLGIDDGFL